MITSDDLGWNHTLGIDQDSYDAIQDLLFNGDYYDSMIYHCEDLYTWVELLKIREAPITVEDCLSIVERIYEILYKYLNKARSSGEDIQTLNQLLRYIMINSPIEAREVKNRINYLDSILK